MKSSTNSPRYIVDEQGTQIRPHRVFDTHKRIAIIHTADPLIASRMAEDYEKQWLRSTWRSRSFKQPGRALRRALSLFKRPASVPAVEPTVRDQRVAYIEELCEKGRQKLAALRSH